MVRRFLFVSQGFLCGWVSCFGGTFGSAKGAWGLACGPGVSDGEGLRAPPPRQGHSPLDPF